MRSTRLSSLDCWNTFVGGTAHSVFARARVSVPRLAHLLIYLPRLVIRWLAYAVSADCETHLRATSQEKYFANCPYGDVDASRLLGNFVGWKALLPTKIDMPHFLQVA